MCNINFKNNSVYIKGLEHFDLANTLDCGQAFRWSADENNIWSGVAHGIYLRLEKLEDGTIVLYDTNEQAFNHLWRDYFDLDRDYDTIISAVSGNEILKTAYYEIKPMTPEDAKLKLQERPTQVFLTFVNVETGKVNVMDEISKLINNLGIMSGDIPGNKTKALDYVNGDVKGFYNKYKDYLTQEQKEVLARNVHETLTLNSQTINVKIGTPEPKVEAPKEEKKNLLEKIVSKIVKIDFHLIYHLIAYYADSYKQILA